jgi:hypothetical protein
MKSYMGVLLETKTRGDSPLADWCFPLSVSSFPLFFFLPSFWSPSVYGFLTLVLSLLFFPLNFGSPSVFGFLVHLAFPFS